MTAGNNPSVYIKGVGSYVPEKILTNQDLSKVVDTSDEWIVTRTGIKERRVCENGQECSDIAVAAGRKAIESAGLHPSDIDAIIVGTITPDMIFPSTACMVQKKLGLENIPCTDVQAACTGFLYVLDMARGMLLTNHRYNNILIIGAEKLSSIIDWSDRSTCVLFGDGAGAAVIARTPAGATYGVNDIYLGADGSNPELLNIPAGGSSLTASEATLAQGQHFLKMNGKEVFKFASRVIVQASEEILNANNLSMDDVDIIIPHQANIRIIENASKAMKVPMDKFFINLDRYGNTSAASVPVAMDEAVSSGLIQAGHHVLLVAFGAGLTWGSALVKWH